MDDHSLQYLVDTFSRLARSQGGTFAIPIKWAAGGGYLTVSRLEWQVNTTNEQRLALVRSRLETLYRLVNNNLVDRH